MKKSPFLAVAALTLSFGACSPEIFTMNLEMRRPSLSGMDLTGKSISVAYVDGKDSVFSRNLATGFAEALENDYFGGEQAVSIYRMPAVPEADYSSRDTLVSLVLDSGHDVVFLFDEPVFNEPSFGQRRPTAIEAPDSTHIVSARVPFELRMYAYDALNKADTVRIFVGASALNQMIYTSGTSTDDDLLRHLWDNTLHTAAQAEETGTKSAAKFKSEWKGESFSFFYYETSAWIAAAEDAYAFRWQEAMTRWMDIIERTTGEQRACAEYNMAAACYILGDPDLAAKWLDLSDKDGKVDLSPGLRKRILGQPAR